LILTLVSHAVPSALVEWVRSHSHLDDPAGIVGKIVATGVVVFWNFLASKYWTFKR
jgi:putative flippase GtrA